jgi:hypothetical protein
MKSPEAFMPAIEACLEKLITAAKASALPGSYHIAFHLATMALEEIGKSSMIFIDAIDHKPVGGDEETNTPLKWVDDHERKLFWAIWLPLPGSRIGCRAGPYVCRARNPWRQGRCASREGSHGPFFSFIAQANQQQFESTHRYFHTLGLMAKNDIFYQFEPNIFIEFISALKDAMQAYGDWDGKPETAEASITGFFDDGPASAQFTEMVRDFLHMVDHVMANKIAPRAITLDDVVRAKLVFDSYIKVTG